MNERKIASKILYAIENEDAYINVEISKTFENSNFSSEEKGLISELVHGVTERRLTLDYIISQFSKIKLSRIAPKVLIAIRLGVYQIFYMDKIPHSAAVNESVKLAKSVGGQRSGGFVNARNVLRNKDGISFPKEQNNFLSIYYSYPIEIIDLFLSEFGYDFTKDMLESFSKRTPTSIRCNILKTDAQSLQASLSNDGVRAKIYDNISFPGIDYALTADKIRNIEKLPSYNNGEFYIQDVAAMLVSEVLNPQSGNVVIDVCAAPGGKTTHIAEKMGNIGKVIAFDIYEHKIKLINENAKRLGISICDAMVWDSSVLNSDYINTADCVLVDAPCSGLGIVGKKPDIKYQRKISDVTELAEISFKILSNGAKYVKSGGTLVFSTCTITKRENEGVVERFLQAFGDEFYLEPIEQIKKDNAGYITLFPHIDGTDGFFICKLRRK